MADLRPKDTETSAPVLTALGLAVARDNDEKSSELPFSSMRFPTSKPVVPWRKALEGFLVAGS